MDRFKKSQKEIITAQKMKFSNEEFFSKCDQIRSKLRILLKFTEEILNRKLHFLCSELHKSYISFQRKAIFN